MTPSAGQLLTEYERIRRERQAETKSWVVPGLGEEGGGVAAAAAVG